jgi:colanic acid/amylovoran biosynthesis glycosyltransferase
MTLTVIGDSSGARREEDEKRKIMETVRRHKLEDSVTFLGFQSHDRFIEELYKHHLFISPSITASDGDTEGGSPVAITEASASGMPVISTRHCDIPEVVVHSKTGLLSEEKDVAGLHKSILHFIKDKDALKECGSMGRAHIESKYNISRQLLELDRIYRSLTNNPVRA